MNKSGIKSPSDVPVWCMKCKRKTPTKNITKQTLKNRHYLKGVCTVCDTKKSMAISKGGFLFSLLGNLLKPIFG